MNAQQLEPLVRRAIEIAVANVALAQRPYGALVVREGTVLAEGRNRVLETGDPTAHAEVDAIRAACLTAGSEWLTSSVLVASCDPCLFCRTAAQLVGIRHIVHAGACDSGLRVEWPKLDVVVLQGGSSRRPFEVMRATGVDLNAGRRRAHTDRIKNEKG